MFAMMLSRSPLLVAVRRLMLLPTARPLPSHPTSAL